MSITHACAVEPVVLNESAADPAFSIFPAAYITALPLSSVRESIVDQVCVLQSRTRVALGFSVVPVTTTLVPAVTNVCGNQGVAQLALCNRVHLFATGS